MAMKTEVTVFWVVILCTIQRHNPEDRDLKETPQLLLNTKDLNHFQKYFVLQYSDMWDSSPNRG